MLKKILTVILVALFKAITHSFKSARSLACKKYRRDKALMTVGGKATLVTRTHSHIHRNVLQKYVSMLGHQLILASVGFFLYIRTNKEKKGFSYIICSYGCFSFMRMKPHYPKRSRKLNFTIRPFTHSIISKHLRTKWHQNTIWDILITQLSQQLFTNVQDLVMCLFTTVK